MVGPSLSLWRCSITLHASQPASPNHPTYPIEIMATQSTRAPLINHELNQSICLKRASLPQSLTSTTLHASQPLSGYMAMQHHPINPYLYRWRVPLCMQSEQPMTVHAGAPAYHPYLSLWRASLNRPPAGRSNHFHFTYWDSIRNMPYSSHPAGR